jgi:S-adenosylmethionine decarboxylase
MKTLGRHLIAEYYGCEAEVLDDPEGVMGHMKEAARICGATVVGEASHRFSPCGVSGTVLIAESHLSVHTWPRQRYVAVDIFTCGGLDPRPGFEYLGEAFAASSLRVQEILRGLPDEIAEHDLILPEDVRVVTEMGEARRL